MRKGRRSAMGMFSRMEISRRSSSFCFRTMLKMISACDTDIPIVYNTWEFNPSFFLPARKLFKDSPVH